MPSLDAAPPATSSTITPTVVRPATQPAAKAGPLVRARGVSRMRITATIGTGLRATPTAEGSSSPITSPSTAGLRRTPERGDRGAPADLPPHPGRVRPRAARRRRPGGRVGQYPKSWVQVHEPWCRPTPIVVKPQLRMLARWPDEFIQASWTAWAPRWPWAMFSPPGLRVAGGPDPVGERPPVERGRARSSRWPPCRRCGPGRRRPGDRRPGAAPHPARPAPRSRGPRPGRSRSAGGGGGGAGGSVVGGGAGGSVVGGAWGRRGGGRRGRRRGRRERCRRRRRRRRGTPRLAGSGALVGADDAPSRDRRRPGRRRSRPGRCRRPRQPRGDHHPERGDQRHDEHGQRRRGDGTAGPHAPNSPLTAHRGGDVRTSSSECRRPHGVGLGNDRFTRSTLPGGRGGPPTRPGLHRPWRAVRRWRGT